MFKNSKRQTPKKLLSHKNSYAITLSFQIEICFGMYFEIGWNLNIYRKTCNLEVKKADIAFIRTIYCLFSLTSHTEFTLWYMCYSSPSPSNRGQRRDVVLKQTLLLKNGVIKMNCSLCFLLMYPHKLYKNFKENILKILFYSKWI